MKILNRFIYIAMLSASFAACQNEEDGSALDGHAGDKVVFSTQIMQSRTTTNGHQTSFDENDRMGVFELARTSSEVLSANLPYSYVANNWISESSIFFPIDGSDVNFYAYYPYSEGNNGVTFDFSVSADQATDGYDNSDLLLAKNEQTAITDKEVTLNFTHALAMVEANISLPEGVTPTEVTIKARLTASVDVKAGTTSVKADASVSDITMKKEADGTYRAIVPAQTLNGKCLLVMGSNGAPYWYFANNVELQTNKVNQIIVTCQ